MERELANIPREELFVSGSASSLSRLPSGNATRPSDWGRLNVASAEAVGGAEAENFNSNLSPAFQTDESADAGRLSEGRKSLRFALLDESSPFDERDCEEGKSRKPEANSRHAEASRLGKENVTVFLQGAPASVRLLWGASSERKCLERRHFLMELNFVEVASWLQRQFEWEGPGNPASQRLLHWRILPLILRSLAFSLFKFTSLLSQDANSLWAKLQLLELDATAGVLSKDEGTREAREKFSPALTRKPRVSYGGLDGGEGRRRKRRRRVFSKVGSAISGEETRPFSVEALPLALLEDAEDLALRPSPWEASTRALDLTLEENASSNTAPPSSIRETEASVACLAIRSPDAGEAGLGVIGLGRFVEGQNSTPFRDLRRDLLKLGGGLRAQLQLAGRSELLSEERSPARPSDWLVRLSDVRSSADVGTNGGEGSGFSSTFELATSPSASRRSSISSSSAASDLWSVGEEAGFSGGIFEDPWPAEVSEVQVAVGASVDPRVASPFRLPHQTASPASSSGASSSSEPASVGGISSRSPGSTEGSHDSSAGISFPSRQLADRSDDLPATTESLFELAVRDATLSGAIQTHDEQGAVLVPQKNRKKRLASAMTQRLVLDERLCLAEGEARPFNFSKSKGLNAAPGLSKEARKKALIFDPQNPLRLNHCAAIWGRVEFVSASASAFALPFTEADKICAGLNAINILHPLSATLASGVSECILRQARRGLEEKALWEALTSDNSAAEVLGPSSPKETNPTASHAALANFVTASSCSAAVVNTAVDSNSSEARRNADPPKEVAKEDLPKPFHVTEALAVAAPAQAEEANGCDEDISVRGECDEAWLPSFAAGAEAVPFAGRVGPSRSMKRSDGKLVQLSKSEAAIFNRVDDHYFPREARTFIGHSPPPPPPRPAPLSLQKLLEGRRCKTAVRAFCDALSLFSHGFLHMEQKQLVEAEVTLASASFRHADILIFTPEAAAEARIFRESDVEASQADEQRQRWQEEKEGQEDLIVVSNKDSTRTQATRFAALALSAGPSDEALGDEALERAVQILVTELMRRLREKCEPVHAETLIKWFLEDYLPGTSLEAAASKQTWEAKVVYAVCTLVEEAVFFAEAEELSAVRENEDGSKSALKLRCPFWLQGVADHSESDIC